MTVKKPRNLIPDAAIKTMGKVNMQGLALAWFDKADWPRWLEIDRDFEASYSDWKQRCESALKQVRESGQIIEKVLIQPDAFLKWSAINGGKVDSNARSTYAAIMLRERTSPTRH